MNRKPVRNTCILAAFFFASLPGSIAAQNPSTTEAGPAATSLKLPSAGLVLELPPEAGKWDVTRLPSAFMGGPRDHLRNPNWPGLMVILDVLPDGEQCDKVTALMQQSGFKVGPAPEFVAPPWFGQTVRLPAQALRLPESAEAQYACLPLAQGTSTAMIVQQGGWPAGKSTSDLHALFQSIAKAAQADAALPKSARSLRLGYLGISIQPPAGLEWKVVGQPAANKTPWADGLERVDPGASPFQVLFMPSVLHCQAHFESYRKSGHKLVDGSDRLPPSWYQKISQLDKNFSQACLESGANDAFLALIPVSLSDSDKRVVRAVLDSVAQALPPAVPRTSKP